MKRLALFIALLPGCLAADGGELCRDSYSVHFFPRRELTLQSVTLNGRPLDSAAAADFSMVLPQEGTASHTVFPFRIFARTLVAEEETGSGDSVSAFWLPDSFLAERIRFTKKP
jgi:hypothetical protein